MKVRKMMNDDFLFGRGSADFHVDNPDGVCQNVVTRLRLWRRSWAFDVDEGTPWREEVLGHRMLFESVIRDRILGTPGVRSLVEFEAILNPDTRRVNVYAKISTVFGVGSIKEEM